MPQKKFLGFVSLPILALIAFLLLTTAAGWVVVGEGGKSLLLFEKFLVIIKIP